ncbi:hypothetical protein CRG98_012892 [Punica granatum]|uniref:Uncharacterized protein n=1 Tax=Punica granatum TaxID=22663 RepID=A0A2I0KDU7_PUNGR|nr:hypothetical protein CRG98_012892 [Punica granatum]
MEALELHMAVFDVLEELLGLHGETKGRVSPTRADGDENGSGRPWGWKKYYDHLQGKAALSLCASKYDALMGDDVSRPELGEASHFETNKLIMQTQTMFIAIWNVC